MKTTKNIQAIQQYIGKSRVRSSIYENKRDFLNWEHSKGAGGLSLPKGKTTHAGDVCQVAEHKEPSFPPVPPSLQHSFPPPSTHTSLSHPHVFPTVVQQNKSTWWKMNTWTENKLVKSDMQV